MTVGDLRWESSPLYRHPSGLRYLSQLFAAISKSQGKSCFRWPDTKFSVLRHISEQVMRVAVCETRRRRRPGWSSGTAHSFRCFPQPLMDFLCRHWLIDIIEFPSFSDLCLKKPWMIAVMPMWYSWTLQVMISILRRRYSLSFHRSHREWRRPPSPSLPPSHLSGSVIWRTLLKF